jgi:hypothetical protein
MRLREGCQIDRGGLGAEAFTASVVQLIPEPENVILAEFGEDRLEFCGYAHGCFGPSPQIPDSSAIRCAPI